MSKIGDLRAGLKTNLDTIPGVNVSKFALSNPVGGPLLHLWPTNVTYHGAMSRGVVEATFRVQAVVHVGPVDQGPQFLMDKMIDAEGDNSVVAAVESDLTLGGACDSLIVEGMDSYEIVELQDNTTRLLAAWSVRILVGSA